MLYNIKVGSITNAQRARRVLREQGIKAYIIRLSNPGEGDGCGYAVKVNAISADGITAMLEGEGIGVLGVETV